MKENLATLQTLSNLIRMAAYYTGKPAPMIDIRVKLITGEKSYLDQKNDIKDILKEAMYHCMVRSVEIGVNFPRQGETHWKYTRDRP